MKKSFICLLILASVAITGCNKSSNEFLTYDNYIGASNQSVDNRITQTDFFAKNIAVLSDSDSQGQDEQLNSGATLLVDVTHSKVLYANQIYEKMYPASLTKLLTTLVVLKYGEMTDMVTISRNAASIADIGAKVIGFQQGDVTTLETLLHGLLISSGNDAAIAIAEHLSGSEEDFVTLMNEEASKIGAVHSNFVNCHGLHDDMQYTTAYDMYLIMNELLTYDTFIKIFSTEEYKAEYKTSDGIAKDKTLITTNDFLNESEEITSGFQVLGGITGSTRKAGKCMVLLSKDTKETTYISLILKAPDNETLYTQMNYLLTKE